ncbi:hypothetical protein FB567DRAFT_593827 [Paraphoma chrysanthemicola]|uniref:Uncharacterized protein n=1 Tax=Paraphoma chrysanthemicola TaxID=798071 RepID=A0A8K0VXZ8_9PLEO|nr:hypothetical protein FB567DRAFT_593827 [Paraphoma chrysanthemicola]
MSFCIATALVFSDFVSSHSAGIDDVDFDRAKVSAFEERTGLQARPLSLDIDFREPTFFIFPGNIEVCFLEISRNVVSGKLWLQQMFLILITYWEVTRLFK